jgi:ClpP class serine protease
MMKNKKRIQAVAFVINSPGGSLTHSNLVAGGIRGFCDENKLKLLTFTDSLAASGGYYVLCVGDEVYASKPALVGSVGALASSIDLHSLLEKYNLHRLYLTSQE